MPKIMIFAAMSLLSATASAQPSGPVSITPQAMRAHVEFLADDLLEGREAGTRGHEIAARYVAQQFAAMGLKPTGVDGGWYQPVTLREIALTEKGSSLTLTGPKGAQRWTNATAVVVGPDRFEAERVVDAPVVFVGWGIDAPAQGFEDYRGLDVTGKIVASFGGVPKGTPSEIGAHLSATKNKMAQDRGAIGLIDVATLEEEAVLPWSEVIKYLTRPFMAWVGPDGRAYSSAPKLQASSGFDSPAAEKLFEGAPKSFAQLRAEAEKPNARIKGFLLPTRARIERSTRFRDLTSPNVLGLIEGSDPRLKDEVVVLMAHLDHLGVRADNSGDKIYNGAMDNAAGVATIIEAARALTAKPLKRSVLLLVTTAEEKGLLGADYFAHYPTLPIERMVAIVNLDMPLLTYAFSDITAFGAEASTLGRAVTNAATSMNITVTPDPTPEERIFVRSDHYALVKKGVPAVFLKTGEANGGAAQWKRFRKERYHQPNDDLTLPIDWDAGARFARLNTAIIREIADAPERPRWYQGNFFGDTFAASAAKASR